MRWTWLRAHRKRHWSIFRMFWGSVPKLENRITLLLPRISFQERLKASTLIPNIQHSACHKKKQNKEDIECKKNCMQHHANFFYNINELFILHNIHNLALNINFRLFQKPKKHLPYKNVPTAGTQTYWRLSKVNVNYSNTIKNTSNLVYGRVITVLTLTGIIRFSKQPSSDIKMNYNSLWSQNYLLIGLQRPSYQRGSCYYIETGDLHGSNEFRT